MLDFVYECAGHYRRHWLLLWSLVLLQFVFVGALVAVGMLNLASPLVLFPMMLLVMGLQGFLFAAAQIQIFRPGGGSAFARALRAFFPMLGLLVLLFISVTACAVPAAVFLGSGPFSIAKAGALILLIPSLVWLGLRCSQAYPLVLLEAQGPIEALKQSWELTRSPALRRLGWPIVLAFLMFGASAIPYAGPCIALAALPAYLLAPGVILRRFKEEAGPEADLLEQGRRFTVGLGVASLVGGVVLGLSGFGRFASPFKFPRGLAQNGALRAPALEPVLGGLAYSQVQIDGEGHVYLVNVRSAGVQQLVSIRGRDLLKQLELPMVEEEHGDLVSVGDCLRQADGGFLVADSASERVMRLAPEGRFDRLVMDGGATDLSPTPRIRRLAAFADGSFAATVPGFALARRFGMDAALQVEYRDAEAPAGAAIDALGVDGSDRLWVLDSGRKLLTLFDKSGAVLERRSVEGQPFGTPLALAVLPDGQAYLAGDQGLGLMGVDGKLFLSWGADALYKPGPGVRLAVGPGKNAVILQGERLFRLPI